MAAGRDSLRSAVVIGANGLVGRSVGAALDSCGIAWRGTYNIRAEKGLIKLDVIDRDNLDRFFSDAPPSVVFHCANLAGGVDFCEANPALAKDFYLNAVVGIGKHCRSADSTLVLISTDYVFDGTAGPYGEDDAANPVNLYGRLKFEAEQWIRGNLDKHIIARTTNVYGWDPLTVTPNFIMGLYRAIADKKRANVPSFLWGNPTYVGDIAGALAELYTSGSFGTFHVVGSSFVNRMEWASHACAILGLDASYINEIKEPSPGMVKRPLKSWLNTDKFTRSFNTVLHDLDDGLGLMKRDIENSNTL